MSRFTEQEQRERREEIEATANVLWAAVKGMDSISALTAYAACNVVVTIILGVYEGDKEKQDEMLLCVEKYLRELLTYNQSLLRN